jgi:hypothetical protein
MSAFRVHAQCPTLGELAEFIAGRDDTLRAHVASCRRCAALTRRIEPAESASAETHVPTVGLPGASVRREGGRLVSAGDIIVASSPDAPEMLLVCVVLDVRTNSDQPTFEVAPVTTELAMASDFDVVVEPADPLGYPALVEVWNHGTLLASQVVERIGRLPDTPRVATDAMYRELHGAVQGVSKDVTRGVPIESDEDPRAEFQEAESERAREFWKPAGRLYGEPAIATEPADDATVGDLLTDYLRRSGWDVPSYATHIGWPVEELAALCADSFEPRHQRPELIGMALWPAIIHEDQFESALRRTISINQFAGAGESATSQGMTFPRAAQPGKRRSARPSAQAPRDPAIELERYVQRAVRGFRRAAGK